MRNLGTLTLALILAASGCSRAKVPSLSDLPRYPGASAGESMAGFAPGGQVGASLAQFQTTDSYDDVLRFYTEAFAAEPAQVVPNTTPLGRATAITLPREDGAITVAIQEFTEEDAVNITFMAVGH